MNELGRRKPATTATTLRWKNMRKIFDIVTQRNVLFLIISIIFALPFISFAPFVKTVDNVDYFTLKNDPDVEFYDKFNLTQCPNSGNRCINIWQAWWRVLQEKINRKVPESPESVKTVIFLKGRAILLSSLILCIGFGVLILSRFVPTINFGMLSAIIMITAVIGDLVVLPSIILCKRG